jgi:endonuclease/exonuclease/phosphatase family protein
MVRTGTDGALVNLVVTNFSGGKRHSGRGGMSGDTIASTAQLDPLAGMAKLADSVRSDGGFVLAIQEMTTDDPGLPIRALDLEKSLGKAARSSFVPRVSTAWYPLKDKWGAKIDPGNAHNEGLCVVSSVSGLTLTPWSSLLNGPEPVDSPTRVVDLPNFGFPSTEAEDCGFGWLEAEVPSHDGSVRQLRFRPTFYRGNRDSDPRAAQACLLAWGGIGDHGPDDPACIIVNVHLSTLTTEYERGIRGRRSRPEATFLRSTQLDVIARYVEEARRAHDLPVIIAGDFNAEPDSPEMLSFAEKIRSSPLLTAERCWKCGTVQRKRPKLRYYTEFGLDLTLEADPNRKPAFDTDAICSNDQCREPRFTHKGHLQLLDNIFFLPATGRQTWEVLPGQPRVDISWGYSDHAAIIVPLRMSRSALSHPEERI